MCEGYVLSDSQCHRHAAARASLPHICTFQRATLVTTRSVPYLAARVPSSEGGGIRPCQNRVNTPYRKTFPQRGLPETLGSRPFPVAIAGGLWLESTNRWGTPRRRASRAAQLRHQPTQVRTNPRMAFAD